VIVFPDTNVWLSATLFPGLCESLIVECADRGWLISSALVRREAHAVLERKFPHVPDARRMFDRAWREARRVADAPPAAEDNDARLVAAASAAGASLFVTGDKRVLRWHRSGEMRILAPRDAWTMLFSP
jgi:predicted nucleic acid-binding protein